MRALRWGLTISLLFAGIAAAAWLEREVLLQGAADLRIVSDPVTHGDAVVVLGGGLDLRPFAAADLYRKGLANKVLVSRVLDNTPAVSIGALLGHTELNRKVLLILGVPEAAIEIFGIDNSNTVDEARALKAWAQHNAAAVLIVPTEIFAGRRIRWSFQQEFHGTDVRIEVPSFETDGMTRAGWWKTHKGLIAFQTEVLKYIYYRLKY